MRYNLYSCDLSNQFYKQTAGIGYLNQIYPFGSYPFINHIKSTPNNDVYVITDWSGVYKQTAGVGNFTSLAQFPLTDINLYVTDCDASNNVYITATNSSTYDSYVLKQTGGTGDFTSIALPGVTVRESSLCVTPNGDVYVQGNDTGIYDIYKLSGGDGSFTPLNQTIVGNTQAIWCSPSGDIYAYGSVPGYSVGICKLTDGTGDFEPVYDFPTNTWLLPYAFDPVNGDIYSHGHDYDLGSSDVYRQTGGTGSFVRLGFSGIGSISWVAGHKSIICTPNHDVYVLTDQQNVYQRKGGVGDFVAISSSNYSFNHLEYNTYVGIPGIIGGLVARLSGGSSVTNSYWNTETSDQTASAGGEGKTTVEMRTQSTFVDWDFTSLWKLRDNS